MNVGVQQLKICEENGLNLIKLVMSKVMNSDECESLYH